MVVADVKRLVAGLIPALLLFMHGMLSAQNQTAPDKAPRRILVVMEAGGFSQNELIMLKQSFLTALRSIPDGPVPVDSSSTSFPGFVRDRNEAARRAGADSWLIVKVSGKDSPSINVVSFDLLYNIKTLDFSVSRHERLSIPDLYRERWDDVIPKIVKTYPPIPSIAYSRGPPAPVKVTIRAVPGTVITGLYSVPLSVGSDGMLTIELPSPAPYSLRATAFGYIPTTKDIYLDGPIELPLVQDRSSWLRLDAAFQNGFFPGVSANFSIPSLPYFGRLEFTTFRVGIAVNQDQILASLPLSQFTFILGVYLSPEDSAMRWYLGLGPTLRVSLPSGGSLVVDRLLPFGGRVIGGTEFLLAGRLRGFFELTPTLYYTPLPALFAASFGSNNGSNNSSFPYIAIPPLFAVDVLEVRVGVRWVL